MVTHVQACKPGPISERLQRVGRDLPKRTVSTDSPKDDGLHVELAVTQTDFEAAYRLIYHQYLSYGYIDENPAQMRVHLWNALPGSYTVVAKKNGIVIGTLTCILDSDAGLPMDEIAHEALDALRTQGRGLCELSGLAVDTEHSDADTVMRMFQFGLKLVFEFRGATDYVITVNPKHERFYQRMLRFEKIGEVAEYHKVKNAPGVPMRLNLLTLEHTYFEAYGHRSGDRNLHRFFFVDRQAEMKRAINEGLPAREAYLTMRFFKEIFSERTDVLREFDAYETFFRQWGWACRQGPAIQDDGKRVSAATAYQLAQFLIFFEPQVSFA